MCVGGEGGGEGVTCDKLASHPRGAGLVAMLLAGLS